MEHEKFEKICSVDEMMVSFKGRSGIKKYMTKKPYKEGYKFWVLAGTIEYVYTFLITGDNKNESKQEEYSLGLSGQVVLDLCEILPEETDLAFDNYFSSTNLLVRLKEKNI